jgi:Uma2 family endonuclease
MPPVPILDRPGHKERLRPLSVEAYHALGESGLIPEETELLYGFVFNKMSKSPFHSYLCQLIADMLRGLLSPGWLLRIEQPITCKNSEPEPDISVVQGSASDFRSQHPKTADLVIEIAVTTGEYDRDKEAIYAAAGVKEFWILVVPEQKIEVFRDPQGSAYRTKFAVSGDQEVSALAVPSFKLAPSRLLAE